MKRLIGALGLLIAMAAVAQAHFVLMVPGGQDGKSVKVIFSDTLEPDKADYLKKLGGMKFFVANQKGNLAQLDSKKTKLSSDKDGTGAILVNTDTTHGCVIGTGTYGVSTRSDKPFLLNYHPRLVLDNEGRAQEVSAKVQPLQLLVTAVKKGEATVKVLWLGKPVKDAEVAVIGVKSDGALKTDARGEAKVKLPAAKLVGIRARHIEEKPGEYDGKKYDTVRHYATTVFNP